MNSSKKNIRKETKPTRKKETTCLVSFRAAPSQIKYWNEKAKALGVKDFSAFVRGALNSAIYVSQRAEDPAWKKFVKAVQPIAKKILGFGFFDGGAKDFEGSGTDHKGISAEEFKRKIKSIKNKARLYEEGKVKTTRWKGSFDKTFGK